MSELTVYAIDGLTPVVHPDAYVHPSAVLIGDVIIGARCYIGPCACLRGDFGRLILHDGANVQDTCVLHGFPGADTVIEEDGHIGHGAVALRQMNVEAFDDAVEVVLEVLRIELARQFHCAQLQHA